jgi:hypothetical protein
MEALQSGATRYLSVVALVAIALSGCIGTGSATAEEAMVDGWVMYTEGSHEATGDGLCASVSSADQITVRSAGINAFGPSPSDSVIGTLAEGVVTPDGCRVPFQVGPIEDHVFLEIRIGNCR